MQSLRYATVIEQQMIQLSAIYHSYHTILLIIFMNSRSSKRDKKDAKSAEKRHNLKKVHLNMLLYKNCQLPNKIVLRAEQEGRESTSPPKITDRTKARSCLSGYSSSQKNSLEILVPCKKTSVSSWLQEQMKTSLFEKKSKSNYEYMHVIGKGGFGKVFKVKQKKTGQLFAMKEMSKAVVLAKKSNESIRNERQLLKRLKHKLIVNMRQAFQDRDALYLLMDLMPGGDLRYHICKKHRFNEQQTRFFAACIFLALEYMHQQKIIHRDLKPENIVFDSKGYLHLTDLGIAKEFRQENGTDTSGTPGYMAPEVMLKQNHSYEVDYYALGVIVFELMMGKRPYVGRDRRSIKEQIMAKQTVIKKSQIPEGWTIQAADFVNKLIQRRPKARLGWGGSHQLRTHAWLRDFPWTDLGQGSLQSPFRPFCKYNPEEVRYQPTKQDEQMSNMIKQNKMLLRKSAVQQIFEGYTFDEQFQKEQNHTTSSQLNRKNRIQLVDM